MHKLYFFSLLLIMEVMAHSALAQIPPSQMGAHQQQQSIQLIKLLSRLETHKSKPAHSHSSLINPPYLFTVTMKDSSIIEVESKIYDDIAQSKSYVIYTNTKLPRSDSSRTRRIYAGETLSIHRVAGNGNKVAAISTDSCWQFTVVKGAITAYSYLSETEKIDECYLSAFRVGNGPLRLFDPEELEAVIKEDEKAYTAFGKNEYYKAILIYNENRAQ